MIQMLERHTPAITLTTLAVIISLITGGMFWAFNLDKQVALIAQRQIQISEEADDHDAIDRDYFQDNKELHKIISADIRMIRDHILRGSPRQDFGKDDRSMVSEKKNEDNSG